MKRNLNIFIAVAAVAVIAAMLAPVLEAQCVPARKFASRILAGVDATGERVRCTGYGCELNLDTANGDAFCSTNLNTWIGGAGCPLDAWFKQTGAGPCSTPRRCIDADIGSAACNNATQSCPFNAGCDLTLWVEDKTLDGTDAGFLTYRVDQTPAEARTWDYARLQDGAVVLDINPYPVPEVLASSRPTPTSDVEADIQYADLVVHYESAGPASQATGAIKEWDVYQFLGTADPGRDIAGTWTKIAEIPYNNASVTQTAVTIDCQGNTTDNAYLAVGVTVGDDAGNEIESIYVGKATIVECDPDLADPQTPTRLDQRVKRPQLSGDRGERGSQKRGR
jgi:hypothetical protein